MSALRSAVLRLRTAAMKLPKWPLARPAMGLDLDRLGQRDSPRSSPWDRNFPSGDGPRFEVGDVADLLAVVVAGLQAADLEDELGVAEVHDGDLRVGRLPLVVCSRTGRRG